MLRRQDDVGLQHANVDSGEVAVYFCRLLTSTLGAVAAVSWEYYARRTTCVVFPAYGADESEYSQAHLERCARRMRVRTQQVIS